MESLSETTVFKFHPDTLVAVRTMFNLHQPGRMEDAINILEEWIQKQQHFVRKDFSRDYLERMIISNKGLLERVKQKIDKVCTVRNLMTDYLKPRSVAHLHYLNDAVVDGYCPKLTPNHERVYFVKYKSQSQYNPQSVQEFYNRCSVYGEYVQMNDYYNGQHTIIDLRDGNITEFLSNFRITEFRQLSFLTLEAYGFRLKGVHVITPSKLVGPFITIMKQVFSPKLRERIKHHIDLESLHKEIPREILPRELGGNEKSMCELNDVLLRDISSKEYLEKWNNIFEFRTDESKRPIEKFNEEYVNVPGTFRNLVVD